jgi:ADP-ribose pyrophosphatase YjhB (NUDIX family)
MPQQQQQQQHQKKLHDVFQPGLLRGSERLPHDPEKAYAYVEHPMEGWRVYLRSCAFLHEKGAPSDCRRFVAVKRAGAPSYAATWEPPKGQMEGKDMASGKSVKALLEENVRRETEEEAHITHIIGLRHSGLAFQGQEADFPQNWFFQYHIFTGQVAAAELEKAQGWFDWHAEHPKAFARLRRDKKEKDAMAWYSARKTPLNPRWCPQIVKLYFAAFCSSS